MLCFLLLIFIYVVEAVKIKHDVTWNPEITEKFVCSTFINLKLVFFLILHFLRIFLFLTDVGFMIEIFSKPKRLFFMFVLNKNKISIVFSQTLIKLTKLFY